MQNKRHEAQNANPGNTPVIMKRLKPHKKHGEAYTIPSYILPLLMGIVKWNCTNSMGIHKPNIQKPHNRRKCTIDGKDTPVLLRRMPLT